jgi:hypothetical protein
MLMLQNAVRISRALFDIVLRKNNPIMAARCLILSQMFEQQQWNFETPMRQFRVLGPEIIRKIEEKRLGVENLRDMDVKEIGEYNRSPPPPPPWIITREISVNPSQGFYRRAFWLF